MEHSQNINIDILSLRTYMTVEMSNQQNELVEVYEVLAPLEDIEDQLDELENQRVLHAKPYIHNYSSPGL